MLTTPFIHSSAIPHDKQIMKGKSSSSPCPSTCSTASSVIFTDSSKRINDSARSSFPQEIFSAGKRKTCNVNSHIPSFIPSVSSTQAYTYIKKAQDAKEELEQVWGVECNDFNVEMGAPLSRSRLTSIPDAILISESWNKILGFRSMFIEALIGRWRVLAAADEIRKEEESKFKSVWIKNIVYTRRLKPTVNDWRTGF